ncbi:MAG: Mur ligase family protein [Bacteroidales bacterium]|jgi:UDP-N-acetylmuramate: L-alanyl-gamma-D-glutamyl-meso-diaminopimelate ligase|nr:Mur ligase family protein [Bacteroidales bacterium]MDD2204827.1 Mur ligase family protein [Bacteroidales bacterium]MDD3914347.1 Mur ligase family protein [Bacteroidales bacterium]MDD4634104.1 Mur ligase family protein [Bacteroidales bacterium]
MHYHFISIGGSIMHNLAIAMHLKGNKVTGSDDEIFEPAKSNLKKYGILPTQLGWHPENITKEIDTVILGMHAKADNPELQKALELGLNIVSFPEFVYENSKDKKRVVIGGSHGKTTITSMVLHVLKCLNINADFLVGAKIPDYDIMVKITDDAKILVVEGDEYLTSTLDKRPKFHLYHPHIALLTGIAWDHFNVFPTFDFYVEQFKIFAHTIEPDGSFIYFEQDENLVKIAAELPASIKTIAYDTPDYTVENNTFILHFEGEDFPLKIDGRHNMQNVLGAMKICSELGIGNREFLKAISSFTGAAKRLEKVYQNENLVIYRDFAHAPSKLKATVNAIREKYPDKKIIAVFELHTYSSLNKYFLSQYKDTMNDADKKMVFFDPHALSLKRLPMLEIDDVKKSFGCDDITVYNDTKTLIDDINTSIDTDCVLLLMSSGNFGGMTMQDFLK